MGLRASVMFLMVILAGAAHAQDTDADGILDASDNCVYVSNPGQEDLDADGRGDVCDNCTEAANGPSLPDAGGNDQYDVDLDGFGNLCDGDYNDDGAVGVPDYLQFGAHFNQCVGDAAFNALTDHDGDDCTDADDFALFTTLFGLPRGPRGSAAPERRRVR